MIPDDVRRIVVIKNVASNYIEEAIFVLRRDFNIGSNLLKKDKQVSGKFNNDKDYLIKEAQLIIDDYIKECEKKGVYYLEPSTQRPPNSRKKILKSRLYINIIINSALFGSIAILLFFLIKIFFY